MIGLDQLSRFSVVQVIPCTALFTVYQVDILMTLCWVLKTPLAVEVEYLMTAFI